MGTISGVRRGFALVLVSLAACEPGGGERVGGIERTGAVAERLTVGSDSTALSDGHYWATVSVASLGPTLLEPQPRAVVAAMEFSSCAPGATFLGSGGWSTFSVRAGVPGTTDVHPPSNFPPAPPDKQCRNNVGGPKVATDQINTVFLAQMCARTPAPTPPLGGAQGYAAGVVMGTSTDRGLTMGSWCPICGSDAPNPNHRHCNPSSGQETNNTVDGADIYFDLDEGALYGAWRGVADNTLVWTRTANPGGCAWDPTEIPKNIDATTGGELPSVVTLGNNGAAASRLVIAYKKVTNPSGNAEIHVAFSDPPTHPTWTDVLIENVAVASYVAVNRVKQDPRPHLIRQSARGSSKLVLAYPAYNSATATNEIHTRFSSDGATWTAATIPGVAGKDRFYPALSTRRETRELLVAFYENQDAFGHLMVEGSQFDVLTNTWSNPVAVSSTWFQPCVLVVGSSDAFYGEYVGMAATNDASSGPQHWAVWADSRASAITELWRAPLVP